MLDYAPFQKCAHYVSVNVPLCIQHIVLDINQIRVISIIIIKYPERTEFALFYYKICISQNSRKSI